MPDRVDFRLDAPGREDFGTVLARRPAGVLMDRLDESEPTDPRGAARWQLAVELLDAGIDVDAQVELGTIASRADVVAAVTGRPAAATIPDWFLERAGTVALFESDRAEPSLEPRQCLALRALALRLATEQCERLLTQTRRPGGRAAWRSPERLMVGVGFSPFSAQLIRWTGRTAAAFGAPWLAVHVETSRPSTPGERGMVENQLALVRTLGGEVVVTRDDDVAAALVRVARDRDVTQVVVGKSGGRRWPGPLRHRPLGERLAHSGGPFDIHIIPTTDTPSSAPRLRMTPANASRWGEYALVVATLVAITAAGLMVKSSNHLHLSLGLVYLLAVMLLSLRVGRGPMLLAGMLSALTWEYVFIPPRFAIVIATTEDALMIGTYLVVALVAGELTARIRAQAQHERLREERATALFQLTHTLAEARTLDEAVELALRQIDRLFAAHSALALPAGAEGPLELHSASAFGFDGYERQAAEWAHRHRLPAGRFTPSVAGCGGYYEPLVREDRSLGVLGVKVPTDRFLPVAQRELIGAFARQLALAVEREQLRQASERERLLAESDRLHRALLDSVSHELRTPLAVIAGAADDLEGVPPETRNRLLGEIRIAALRLNRVVGNLLDQTRLESGALGVRPQWYSIEEVIRSAIKMAGDAVSGHAIRVEVPESMPPAFVDWTLTEHAVTCLLLNALTHTPPGTPISVSAGFDAENRQLLLRVADRGPGVPPAIRERLFQKFVRGAPAVTGGLGLGLSIVRGFTTAQGGTVAMSDHPGGGAVFAICLPQPPTQNPAAP